MLKQLSYLISSLILISIINESTSIQTQSKPSVVDNLNLTYIQQVGSCSYTVVITTSCSSVKYTRDQISITFGDAYGNQIYAPRLDDPSTRTFERCSTDTFQINGPCAYQLCYVLLHRNGPDGWMPESVKLYGYNSRAVTYYYNTFIPNDAWYGFNECSGSSSSSILKTSSRWIVYSIVALGFVMGSLL
ncbi:hypothetical protein ACFE04_027636 [Oxalis oulophora]